MQNYIESASFPILSQFPPTDDWYTFFCSCGGRIDFKDAQEAEAAINSFMICPKCFKKYRPDDIRWMFQGRGQLIELPQDKYREVENKNEKEG